MKRYPIFLIVLLVGSLGIQLGYPLYLEHNRTIERAKLKFLDQNYDAWDRVMFDPVSIYER